MESNTGLSGQRMLAWHQRTAQGWQQLVADAPAVLDVPCDVYGVSDLRGLLHHIAVVQLRFTQRLAGEPEMGYDDIGKDADSIFAAMERAHTTLARLLEMPDYDWTAKQQFKTISWGQVESHRSTMFAHALMHGIRHFAQAAMLARQAGHKPDWSMDYIGMDVVRVDAQ